MTVSEIAKRANSAGLILAHLSTEIKNQTLNEMANALEANYASILSANKKDLEFANKEGIAKPLIARLALNEDKIRGMAQGIRSVVSLPDPAGVKRSAMELDEGLILYQVTCPIGVIGAIFESRPDAVPQISSLCLKSGNAVILKGGREAQNSNKAIVGFLTDAINKVPGVPDAAVQMIETRTEVQDMLKEEKSINLIVPRGSNDFVKYIQDNTKIPVLGHSEGICHNYIDEDADLNKALKIAFDSKLQYPAACNAMENLLIHKGLAPRIIPQLVKIFEEQGVSLLGCENTRKISKEVSLASDNEWDEEYNDLKLSIKIVENLDEAIAFINCHGSGHTDTVVTENSQSAEKFMNEVNSASVMWNASTRFADGFRYGLGAEIGISTNKTHARGPVGLEGLVIYKYRVYGNGQIVRDYEGKSPRTFTHKPL
ncbi:MAG: glutamate-5-semialdehyde dehydrogenase [Nitrospinota bacterium]|nr:glutamate-5-semialdehyde dehydrogenase [Nitrospinota bacterium]